MSVQPHKPRPSAACRRQTALRCKIDRIEEDERLDLRQPSVHRNGAAPQPRIAPSKRYVHGRQGGGQAPRRDELLLTAILNAADSGVASGQLARMITRWAKLWRLPELRERLTFRKNPRLRTTVAR